MAEPDIVITAHAAGEPSAARCSRCGSLWSREVIARFTYDEQLIAAHLEDWKTGHLCIDPTPPPVPKVRRPAPKNNPPSTPHRYHKDPDDELDDSLKER